MPPLHLFTLLTSIFRYLPSFWPRGGGGVVFSIFKHLHQYYEALYLCLTLIVLGKDKVVLANFDVKLQTKFLCIGFFSKFCIPTETSSKYFLTSDMTSKIMFWRPCDVFFQKSSRGATLSTPPSFGFTANTDHLSMGEVPLGPWSTVLCSASQHFGQFLVPGRSECGGRLILSWARSLALSNLSTDATLMWANSRNHSALWHT